MTWRSVWCGAFFICVGVGCTGPDAGPDGSAGLDGGPGEPDAGPDGSAGLDAPGACSPPTGATCGYGGYGTPCPVDCDLPETCSFSITVGWTGGYCCGGGGGAGSETYVDCRCVGGTVRCARFVGSTEFVPPMTTCEFCEPRDVGALDTSVPPDAPEPPDAPSDDAGVAD